MQRSTPLEILFFFFVSVLIKKASSQPRSFFVITEFATILILRFASFMFPEILNHITFIGFFLAKFLQSAGYFFWKCRNSSLPPLRFAIGFKSDPLHAMVEVDGYVAHTRFASPNEMKTRSDEIDPSFQLIPEVKLIPNNYAPFIRHHVVHALITETNAIQRALESCGRCHNWAILTIYQISTDKFFSFAMLLFWRWDFWLLSISSSILWVVSMWYHLFRPIHDSELISTLTEGSFELLFVALAIYDSLNLNHNLLDEWTQKNDVSSWKSEGFVKYIFLCFCWALLLFATSFLQPFVQYLYLSDSFLHFGLLFIATNTSLFLMRRYLPEDQSKINWVGLRWTFFRLFTNKYGTYREYEESENHAKAS